MASSSFAPKAAPSAQERSRARNRTIRAIKARLGEILDAVSGWLDPGYPGPQLQPVRIRATRGGGRPRG